MSCSSSTTSSSSDRSSTSIWNDIRSVRRNRKILVGRILVIIVVLHVNKVGAAPAGGGRSYSEAQRWSADDVTDDVAAVRPWGGECWSHCLWDGTPRTERQKQEGPVSSDQDCLVPLKCGLKSQLFLQIIQYSSLNKCEWIPFCYTMLEKDRKNVLSAFNSSAIN